MEEKPLDAAHTPLDRLISTRSSRIVFTLLLSIGLGYLGNASGLPAASMVFPMIAVAALNCTTSVCAVPLADQKYRAASGRVVSRREHHGCDL